MTIGTLKSANPRNRNSISVIKSKFLSVSSMNTLLAILKVTDARRDVILAGRLYHRFPWRHLPPSPASRCCFKETIHFRLRWKRACMRDVYLSTLTEINSLKRIKWNVLAVKMVYLKKTRSCCVNVQNVANVSPVWQRIPFSASRQQRIDYWPQ